MLTDSELEIYIEQEGLNELAVQVIRNIRNSDPSRRVSSGPSNVASKYPSKKMGCTIQAESHTSELAALYEWDHDAITHEFYDQPPKIKLHYHNFAGKKVTSLHTPDFFVLANGFTGWVECKTEEDLNNLTIKQPERYQKDKNGNWRCPPGEAYAENFGLSYKLRSSSENNWIVLRNILFLSDYMDADCPSPSIQEKELAKSLFKQKSWMSLLELIRANSELSSDAIYKMIVDGDLYFRIDSEPLSNSEYAIIYRDPLVAALHQIPTQNDSIHCVTNLNNLIEYKIGETFFWDEVLWRIDNVGKNSLFIRNTEGEFAEISYESLSIYTKEGKIKGLPSTLENDLKEIAQKVITEADPESIKIALERYHLIQTPDEECTKVSDGTLRIYRSRFNEAERIYGHGLIGLFPRIKDRGNRNRKIDEDVVDLMNKVIREKYMIPIHPNKNSVYGELIIQCKEKGLMAPSSKTFYKEIAKFSEFELTLARSGKRAAYNFEQFYWRIETETPRHGERPFDIVHIDHTQLDIELGDSLYGLITERPWISIMLDANTRKVLAIWISFDEPSYRSCMMLIKCCVKKYNRAPRVIVVDGGPEFDSKYFELLLAYLKITKKSRAKSKSRFGSVMERLFGTTNTQLIHNLSGNTQATKTARTCTASHDPRKHVEWSLAGFSELFEKWIYDVYETNPHKALGTTPQNCFEVGMLDCGMRLHKVVSYDRAFEILCMPSTKKGTALVSNTKGISINYNQYFSPEFKNPKFNRQSVAVKYDPDDASIAYALINKRWVLCQSKFSEEFKRRSVKQIELISKEIKQKNKGMAQKQKVTAEAIAHFIRYAEAKGKVQRQMWRDTERDTVVKNDPIDEESLIIEGEFEINNEIDFDGLNTCEDF